jgi:hypothetical protein
LVEWSCRTLKPWAYQAEGLELENVRNLGRALAL